MSLRHLLIAAILLPATALAADDISLTKHNLSTTGTGDIHLTVSPGAALMRTMRPAMATAIRAVTSSS